MYLLYCTKNVNKFVANYNCILLFKCGKIQLTKQMPLQ